MVAGEAQVRNLIPKYQAEKLFECRGPRNAQIKVTESSCRISNLYLFICHMITITKRRQKKKMEEEMARRPKGNYKAYVN